MAGVPLRNIPLAIGPVYKDASEFMHKSGTA